MDRALFPTNPPRPATDPRTLGPAMPRLGGAARRGIAGLGLVLGLAWGPIGGVLANPAGDRAVDCVADPAAPALPAWQALGAGAWWLPGAAGDTDASNRGGISNLLAVVDDSGEPTGAGRAPRLWLIGSGPSPIFGRALSVSLRCQLGLSPTDAIAPWSRPELVLGQQGLGPPGAPRSWAHADVIAAMAERCPRCIERLRQRLGERGADLEGVRVDLPAAALEGSHGHLGPLRWWRVPRGDTTLTLWWHPASGVITAHGLLWTDGAPDLRDTDIGAMLAALDAAEAIGQAVADAAAATGADPSTTPRNVSLPSPAPRWLPEQGPLAPPDATGRTLLTQHRRYWLALRDAVERGQATGTAETVLSTDLPGVNPDWLTSPHHALNWQRAWRQAEDAWPPVVSGPRP